jgi:hypothetical protein|tara:strand:- start:761 stop:1210 length:450 start_codon:yes stop_codon:yes gene_type:complete
MDRGYKKMRVTNIDTLSALFDRLITENIKKYFFNKDGKLEETKHQEIVISEVKNKITELFTEVFESGEYPHLSEKRTFDENAIVEELEELIFNDINIGEADRERLLQVNSDNPNIEKLIVNEKRLRKSNEGRARNKNNIDNELGEINER